MHLVDSHSRCLGTDYHTGHHPIHLLPEYSRQTCKLLLDFGSEEPNDSDSHSCGVRYAAFYPFRKEGNLWATNDGVYRFPHYDAIHASHSTHLRHRSHRSQVSISLVIKTDPGFDSQQGHSSWICVTVGRALVVSHGSEASAHRFWMHKSPVRR